MRSYCSQFQKRNSLKLNNRGGVDFKRSKAASEENRTCFFHEGQSIILNAMNKANPGGNYESIDDVANMCYMDEYSADTLGCVHRVLLGMEDVKKEIQIQMR